MRDGIIFNCSRQSAAKRENEELVFSAATSVDIRISSTLRDFRRTDRSAATLDSSTRQSREIFLFR